jgi:hypothetical protein
VLTIGGFCAALNLFQHAGHRHSIWPTPASSIKRRIRHPYDVVSVDSPWVSGESTPQSLQVSRPSI